MFCWNCGHKNEEDFHFCENCGSDLRLGVEDHSLVTSDIPEASPMMVTQQENGNPKEPESVPYFEGPLIEKKKWSKKQKAGAIVGVILVSAIVGTYKYGENYYSYDQQVERMQEVIKTKDPKKWAEITISSDPNFKISAASLKKMTDYYSEADQKEAFSDMVKGLSQKQEEATDFSVVKEGKDFFLFDHYSLELTPVYLTVYANEPDVKVTVDNKEETMDDTGEMKIGPLTPGVYKVKGSLDKVDTESDVVLVRYDHPDFEEASTLKMDFHKVSFKVMSNLEGGDVFVDNKKIGTLKKGELEVKDLVWHQGMSVRVEKKINKETIVSEEREVEEGIYWSENYEDVGSEINLIVEGVQTKEMAQSSLDEMYSHVTDMTRGSGSLRDYQIESLTGYFDEGANNEDYNDFLTFIKSVRESEEKSSVMGTPKVESFDMIGKDLYEVQYFIEYRTRYKAMKRDEVVQTFKYTKATLRYNEEEDKLQIVDLGGKENFEVIDDGGVS